MNRTLLTFCISLILFWGCGSGGTQSDKEHVETPAPYLEDWESLADHNEAPDWFRDAKLGIYFHWGVYSVPAYGSEWYPRWMHFEHRKEYAHHLENYGHPSDFGYHDFVPMFRAEHFDADRWADLFVKAGARFAGPVAEHHDGFSMWDSEMTPWNSMDKGPHRDITGELKRAFDARDLKLITTFHHAKHLQRYSDRIEEEMNAEMDPGRRFRNSHYPLFEGLPPVSRDEELRYLYGNIPEDQWLEEVWFGKLKEVVDKYQPDIIWFDSWLDQIPESYRKKFCAYYLNEAAKWDREVVIVRKQDDLPLDCSVDDLEKSRKNELDDQCWMTDETVSKGSWCYTSDLKIKETADVLHVLIDIVSKNGVLLLNISPKADGTIPENQQEVLLAMGEWLKVYGESIYGTRPWYTFGEGPTREPEGHFRNASEFLKIKYSAADVRYTTREDAIYAILLGQPSGDKELLLRSFARERINKAPEIKGVELLGSEDPVDWELQADGLHLVMTGKSPDEMAVVFKVNI